VRWPGVLLLFALAACPGPKTLGRPALLDPAACQACHPDAFADWSGSMHAYAAEDPVFRAMNRRGQRETNGMLGSFCVNCHAPMAVREKATTDGLNLDTVDPKLKGVTCYFCHNVTSVTGVHDNPLVLANDETMRAEITDPVDNSAHQSKYGALQDRDTQESSQLCGSCHDIVTPKGAAIERTFHEWQGSVFSAQTGASCAQCHMDQSSELKQVALGNGLPKRHFHSHQQVGVDLSLTAGFPQTDVQRQKVQALLDSTLETALCVKELGAASTLSVIADNVAAGHGWPSGAAQDRRLFAEVIAYGDDGGVVFSTGVVPDGGSPVDAGADTWLLRDCMLDDSMKPVSMFWDAVSFETNQLPVLATFDQTDPRFYQTHFQKKWQPGTLPSRVTMRMRLQAVGLDVIDELIASGDLDAGVRGLIPTFDIGAPVEWTDGTASLSYQDTDGLLVKCVSASNLNVNSPTVPAPSNPHCSP
jgi:hypothetical protein